MSAAGATVEDVSAPRSSHLRPLFVAALGLASLALAACSGGGEGIRISAATATTGAATPTVSTTPTAEPTPTPAPVPRRPENPYAGGRLVETYLRDGEPDIEGCLPELVRAWGLQPEVEGQRCALLDLDGDRQDEFVLLISEGSGPDDSSPYPADLWFFEDAEGDHRFFNSARAVANAATTGLRIRSVEDLTGDGLPDVALTWIECGAHTCVTHLTVISHHHGTLENLAPSDASVESLETFEIGGGAITMEGGIAGSVGAGPQRTSTTVVRWAGSRFRTELVEGPPVYLIHLVNDADRIFQAGTYADAERAYLDAAGNNTLLDWKAEIGQGADRAELQAYSTFRAAIAAFRQNNLLGAGRLLERAATQYPTTMHGSAATHYLAALAGGETPERSCEAAETFLQVIGSQYNAFWDFGYANPERSVFTLCR